MTWKLAKKFRDFKRFDVDWNWWLFAVSLLMIGILAYFDYLDGPEVHLSALYMIPVYFSTWFIGFRAGTLLSLISGLTLLIDPIFYPHFYSGMGVVLMNLVSLLVVNTTFTVALTLLKNKHNELHEQLRRDDLTGLQNMKAFYELAERERHRASRLEWPVTVCFLDLDNFKAVNDSRGHLAGSELLKSTADILKGGVRATDLVARFGGDEFVLLFPDTGKEAAEVLAEKLKLELLEGFRAKDCGTTPSLGLVTFIRMPKSVDGLVHPADQLMYEAKKNGKNRIEKKVEGEPAVA